MKYCLKCGEQLQDDARFCTKCGNMAVQSGEGQQVPGANRSEIKQKTGRGNKPKLIIGVLLAVILMAGGFWGWKSYGTEARVQKQLDLAVKYLSDNNYEQAILAFNEVIKIDPKEVKGYQGLARTYTLQGNYDEAKTTYDKGVAAVAQGKQQTLQLGLAGMYIDQGQLENAEKAFQELKNSNQNCLEAYWGLAMVYQQQGDNTKAEAMLRQAIEQNPNDYRGYNTLALFLKQNNKAADAFNNLVRSLSLEINQQEAYLIVSDIYKGPWTAELQGELSSVSNQQVAAMLEFYGYYTGENFQKAVSSYELKLSNQIGNQKARILGAIAMVKNGNKTDADELIEQVLAEKSNDWLLSDIACYYQAAGDNETAKIWAIKAVQANATNLEAVALLQNLNTGNEKIYAAVFLLYNWKPVGKAKEEMTALGLPIPSVSDARQTSSKGQNIETSDSQVEYGNTAGNLANGGLVVEKDNWIYYIKRNNVIFSKICKMRIDGSERTILYDESSENMNVAGGWIYYIHCSSSTIYRMRTDGSGRMKLSDDQSNDINVVGDWIYYVNYSDQCKLYKMRTDGSERIKLSDDGVSFINIVGDWIYYRNDNDSLKIYKMHTDGTGRIKLNDDEAQIIIVAGEWIYFMNNSDKRNIYKMHTDGSSRMKLNDDDSEYINLDGEWIYYSNGNDGQKLYKIRVDGTERTKLNDTMSSAINVAGNWIYYESSGKPYKMLNNGSGQQPVY